MRPYGRSLLVAVILCLGLMPARADATVISLNPDAPVSSGAFDFSGAFDVDNDVALIYLSLVGSAVLSIDFTSLLDPADGELRGFDPIVTFFGVGGDFLGSYDWMNDATFDAAFGVRSIEGLTLAAGSYVLALTHYGNYYQPGGLEEEGFVPGYFLADAAVDGLFSHSFYATPDTSCGSFVDVDGGCRSSRFAGTLTIEPENVPQPVPEPGSLTLLALGGAALLARRGRRSHHGTKAVPRN
jgi:hypothetical protein